MSCDTFAIFAECLAQREQPYEGCWSMEIEGKSGRSQSRQRNSAGRSKTIRSSGGFRRNSKPDYKTGCSIFPACLRSSRNACSTAWRRGNT